MFEFTNDECSVTEGDASAVAVLINRGPNNTRLANPVTLKIMPLNISAAFEMGIRTDLLTIESFNIASMYNCI